MTARPERPHQADADRLRRCGELLHGYGWQRAIARMLGTYHPQGARESIDDRYVRRVAAGTHPAPAWWWQAIRLELRMRRADLRQTRREIDEALGTLPPSRAALLRGHGRAVLTREQRIAVKLGADYPGA